MTDKAFERALHSWPLWLNSITSGRKLLRYRQSRPTLAEMRDVSKKKLAGLGFPICTLFELYWLCCVFADYQTGGCFKFDNLFLPSWFPLPFGFRDEQYYDFRGKRIYPPEIWSEADRRFWFARNPVFRALPPKKRAERYKDFPDNEFAFVLSDAHPIHKYVKKGRPITTSIHGETYCQ